MRLRRGIAASRHEDCRARVTLIDESYHRSVDNGLQNSRCVHLRIPNSSLLPRPHFTPPPTVTPHSPRNLSTHTRLAFRNHLTTTRTNEHRRPSFLFIALTGCNSCSTSPLRGDLQTASRSVVSAVPRDDVDSAASDL